MNTEVRLNIKLLTSLSAVLFIPTGEIIVATGIKNSTWYRIMATPESITIQQLLAIANGLHIPVRRFFSSGKADLIGTREDYITDFYEECRYDYEGLQRIVANSSTATWKEAAKTTGVTRCYLRNSLIAVTRTPVLRFLAVCNAFGIEPFTILIDPNPDVRNRNGKNKTTDELLALHHKIDNLSKTVDDLSARYQALLERQNKLENTINQYLSEGDFLKAAEEPTH